MHPAPDTTQLLLAARAGDRDAFDRLFLHVQDALRQIAHHRLRRHSPGQTLGTTALVHEVYLKLVDQNRAALVDRAHFLALASRAMRFVLVDYARAQAAGKRGGGQPHLPIDNVLIAAEERSADLLELDEALRQLAAVSQRLADTVELHFFGGLTFDEIAEVLGRSVPTIKRDWARARLWLYRAMRDRTGVPS
jgi:RNA polymerase sigma factor (TIGR02999 family)